MSLRFTSRKMNSKQVSEIRVVDSDHAEALWNRDDTSSK